MACLACLACFGCSWSPASRYDWFQHKQSKCHKSNCARWYFGMARFLSSGVPFRTPLDKYPGSSGGPLCETLGTNLTYQVMYHSVRHLIKYPGSSSGPLCETLGTRFTYQVSYHPIGHLMSIRRAALSNFAGTLASRYDWFQNKQSKCHKSNCARWSFGMASRRLACLACLPACLPERLQAGLPACLPARLPAMPALLDAHLAA